MAEAGLKQNIIDLPPNLARNNTASSIPSTLNSTISSCMNCLLIKQEDSKIRAFRRPGIGEAATDANFSSIYNFYNWVGYSSSGQLVYFGVGSSVDKMCVSGVTTYSHADTTKIKYVTEALNSSGTTSLLWTRTSDAWIYPKAGAVAQITAVPSTMVGGFVNIDGWTFIACNTTNGARIYNSTINDPTAGYTDYLAVNIAPDTLVTLYKYKNFCLAFGTDSLEWFQVSDNEFGSPLKRIPQYFSKVGLMSPATDVGVPAICEGNDTIYWVSKGSNTGIPQVYTLEGSKPVKISTPDVEMMLSLGASLNQISIKYCAMKGCRFVLVRGATRSALVYHIDLGIWSVWDASGVEWATTSNFNSDGSLIYVAKSASNTYGTIDPTVGELLYDFGLDMYQMISFPKTHFGTYRKKILRAIRVLGTLNMSANYTITIEVYYDKLSTSTARAITSTGLGLLQSRNWGMFREVQVILTNTGTSVPIDGVELEYEVLDD